MFVELSEVFQNNKRCDAVYTAIILLPRSVHLALCDEGYSCYTSSTYSGLQGGLGHLQYAYDIKSCFSFAGSYAGRPHDLPASAWQVCAEH